MMTNNITPKLFLITRNRRIGEGSCLLYMYIACGPTPIKCFAKEKMLDAKFTIGNVCVKLHLADGTKGQLYPELGERGKNPKI
mgnify:FL=1